MIKKFIFIFVAICYLSLCQVQTPISASFSIERVIRTNITTSLQADIDRKYFATISRQLSVVNSQWIYTLELYNFTTQQKINNVVIYSSYNVNKHYLTFVPSSIGKLKIAVGTMNNLVFYEGQSLRRVSSLLHEQINIYDITASPDGQITVVVGQSIVIFRNNNYKPVIFPHSIENARFCEFSMDGLYMMIASTGMLNIYTYQNINGQFNFQQISLNSVAPVQYGSITSAQFNPTDSSEVIVGFLSTSPLAYSISNAVFFKKLNDIQPMSSNNAKIARYMPDGQRFYSYDFLNGIGLWPGTRQRINNSTVYRLFYKQNMLLYDTFNNLNGTMLIGYLWQTIKVVKINLSNCDLKPGEQLCSCPSGFIWNFPTYQCQKLACLQQQYSTGVVKGGQCECRVGYIFDFILKKCIIDCRSIPNTLNTRKNIYECYCADNWSWNLNQRKCEFNCNLVPFSIGTQKSDVECNCLPNFIWDKSINECVCPPYTMHQGGTCICIPNYTIDPVTSKCIINCSSIENAVSIKNQEQCICEDDFYFTIKNNQPGCQLNCSKINDTIQQNADFSSCLCLQHMNWFSSETENRCLVDCSSISYSDPSQSINNTCICSINYIWIDKIKECARNCSGVKNVKDGVDSTLRSCPCIDNFIWSESNTRCEIRCGKIPNSYDYSLAEIDKCQCRSGFIWNQNIFTCQVDCKNIWGAEQRTDDTNCKCKNDKPFNNKTLTCQSGAAAGLFDSTISIVGFILAIIIGIIILVVLIKFCWGFKTEKKEAEKKIKAIQSQAKTKRVIKDTQKLKTKTVLQDELKTNQRLMSPRKTK